MKTLVLGGARSGKSRFAERQAELTDKNLFYLATGWAGDREMAKRIAHHRQRRGNRWTLVEEPLDLACALQKIDRPDSVVVVDCLTLWLSNLLHQGSLARQRELLSKLMPELNGSVFFVSNEVGSGIVPLGELSRLFADEAGLLNQAMAELCDEVHIVVAGIPLQLKAFS